MITAYNTAVMTMLDDEVPETLDMVVAALRPMVRIREIMSRPAGQGENPSDERLEDELLGDGSDELPEVGPAVVVG